MRVLIEEASSGRAARKAVERPGRSGSSEGVADRRMTNASEGAVEDVSFRARRWMKISADPNAPVVLDARFEELRRAESPALISDREEYLSQLARGHKVLDVGVVDHQIEAQGAPTWLHRLIVRAASYCLGVDILPAAVTRMAEQGYNVRCWDVTAEPLAEVFDVIICGEVIEHLNNPGGLFASAARMLGPGGRLVITTPNPWFFAQIIRASIRGISPSESVDHVGWYDRCTLLEMGKRHGFLLSRYSGVRDDTRSAVRGGWLQRWIVRSSWLWICLGLEPRLFARTIIYEFTRGEDDPPA